MDSDLNKISPVFLGDNKRTVRETCKREKRTVLTKKKNITHKTCEKGLCGRKKLIKEKPVKVKIRTARIIPNNL